MEIKMETKRRLVHALFVATAWISTGWRARQRGRQTQ
jgi:hypothetical protein